MSHSNPQGQLSFVNNHDPKRLDSNLFQQAYQFDIFSFSLEKNFQNRIKELEDYLDNLLVSDTKYLSSTFIYENGAVLGELRKAFKQSALDFLYGIKENFEGEKRMHLFPDSYLRQMVESTKEQLFLSYTHLIQDLIKTITEKSKNSIIENDEIKGIDGLVRHKLKPGKTKFPKKARQILEAWYKNHCDDPFPSHAEKIRLADESGVTVKQVKCWFINVRRKRWNKMNDDADFKAQIQKKLMQNVEDIRTANSML